MNKQVGPNRIEWTHFTSNPIGGCFHGCRWEMPNGEIARCYAEDAAESVASPSYPMGFEHLYWRPHMLKEWARVKEPSRIFVGSMSDVFGHWVPDEYINQVLDAAEAAYWHTFQFLTKNPVRVNNFDIPHNCWIGASTPPDFMWGKRLSHNQQERMLERTLKALDRVRVPWLSAEPLSWGILPVLKQYPEALRWIVIGAASNGKEKYPPRQEHVEPLVEWCDQKGIKIFMKGNLKSLSWAVKNWREEFPC